MTPSWTCSSCHVRATYLPGFTPPALPDGWSADGDGLCCRRCLRESAVAEALREAGLDPFDTAAAKVRTRALVAHELRRDPDQTSLALAKAAGVSTVTAGKLRRELEPEMAGSPA